MPIQTIIQRYLTKFDELNFISVRLLETDPAVAKDDFDDILIDGYIEGFSGVAYMLGVDISLDYTKAAEILEKTYGGESIADKLTTYLENQDIEGLRRLVYSEFHRAYNEGALQGATDSGLNVVKTWVTINDDKVRDTHAYLEGVTAPLDGYFYTFDGDMALAPGGFENASNNANCRCILEYSAE